MRTTETFILFSISAALASPTLHHMKKILGGGIGDGLGLNIGLSKSIAFSGSISTGHNGGYSNGYASSNKRRHSFRHGGYRGYSGCGGNCGIGGFTEPRTVEVHTIENVPVQSVRTVPVHTVKTYKINGGGPNNGHVGDSDGNVVYVGGYGGNGGYGGYGGNGGYGGYDGGYSVSNKKSGDTTASASTSASSTANAGLDHKRYGGGDCNTCGSNVGNGLSANSESYANSGASRRAWSSSSSNSRSGSL